MTFIADIYVIAVLLRAAASCKIVVINQMREHWSGRRTFNNNSVPHPPPTSFYPSLFIIKLGGEDDVLNHILVLVEDK